MQAGTILKVTLNHRCYQLYQVNPDGLQVVSIINILELIISYAIGETEI